MILPVMWIKIVAKQQRQQCVQICRDVFTNNELYGFRSSWANTKRTREKSRGRWRSLSIYAWALISLAFFIHFWQRILRLFTFFPIFKVVAGPNARKMKFAQSMNMPNERKMKRFSFWLIDFKRISLSIYAYSLCMEYTEYMGAYSSFEERGKK